MHVVIVCLILFSVFSTTGIDIIGH